jgi:uncharacterized protein (TIGR00725 family)
MGGTGGHGPLIALCGASTSTKSEDDLAYSVGKLLAGRDAVVVCGGRGGVMSSGAAGARSAGGQVIGLLPGSESSEANPHVSVAIPTGMGQMRNGLIANACAAMIAVGGSYGTLSEIGFMRKLGRPVAALESWKVVPPGDAGPDQDLHACQSPQEAVDWVFQRVG